eukprot:14804401-Heterocapsa_arctica.AAC.1
MKDLKKIAIDLRPSGKGKFGSPKKEDDEMDMLKKMFGEENAGAKYSRVLSKASTSSRDPSSP